MSRTFIQGHVSPETAHMHDHPFGSRRCIQRIWLDRIAKGKKEGQTRVCYQTSQKHVFSAGDDLPETMPAGGEDRNANWNKVKKSTYSIGMSILYLDEAGHVQPFCLRVTDSPERFAEFDEIVNDQLSEFNQVYRKMLEKMNREHYPENWTEYYKARLEYLRGEIEAERMSYGEILELQSLVDHIEPGDVLLLEWAGVPECS